MKKVLILTVTAGNAHNACAKRMKEKLESAGGAEVKIIDLLKSYSTARNAWISDQGYALSVSRLLPVYNAFYRHYRKADPNKRYSCPSQPTILTTVRGLLHDVLEFQPDVVYCTHFYGAIALTDLKLCYNLPCKAVASCLDYVNSPFWEAGIGVDYFAIPNEEFFEEYLSEGFRREQLLPLGLPVDERTLEATDKTEARRRLGLDESVFTVMIMFGGGLWSGGFRILKSLLKAAEGRRIQIIMINGKNEKDFERVKKLRVKEGVRILNVGFTNEVPLYLSAADVMIGKGGGGSVTETVNKGLPLLAPAKMAAQEEYNLAYLKEKGVALSYRGGKDLKRKVRRLMDHPEELRQMSARTQPLKKNALGDLAAFILSQPNADYGEIEKEEIKLDSVKKNVANALKRADKTARKNRGLTNRRGGGY